jgi:hypothetical protein
VVRAAEGNARSGHPSRRSGRAATRDQSARPDHPRVAGTGAAETAALETKTLPEGGAPMPATRAMP